MGLRLQQHIFDFLTKKNNKILKNCRYLEVVNSKRAPLTLTLLFNYLLFKHKSTTDLPFSLWESDCKM